MLVMYPKLGHCSLFVFCSEHIIFNSLRHNSLDCLKCLFYCPLSVSLLSCDLNWTFFYRCLILSMRSFSEFRGFITKKKIEMQTDSLNALLFLIYVIKANSDILICKINHGYICRIDSN